MPSIVEAARRSAVEVTEVRYGNAVALVRAIDAFVMRPGGGLIVMPPPPTPGDRAAILELATQYQLPTIHGFREFAVSGGLMTYGADIVEVWRRASDFVDRVLHGVKVVDLPVEVPTKFELIINLKAAKAIGLTVPPLMLARADEVIE